jgi:hypothetical protein
LYQMSLCQGSSWLCHDCPFDWWRLRPVDAQQRYCLVGLPIKGS